LLVAADPDNADERIIAPVKTNLCASPPSLRFALEPAADAIRIRWLGFSARHADDLVGDEEDSAALREAIAALRELLANGPVAARLVDRTRRELGIPERMWQRARHRLKVDIFKESFSGGWAWQLPATPTAH